jgi:hypothetical protein
MNRSNSQPQRLIGLLLAALLPVVGVSVSLLDMMPEDARSGIESHHHPGTHGPPHNHLICIQQAANQWVRTCETPRLPLALELRLPSATNPSPPAHSSLPHLPRSRAPPLA